MTMAQQKKRSQSAPCGVSGFKKRETDPPRRRRSSRPRICEKRLSEMRLMVVRGQTDDIVATLIHSRTTLHYVARLLSDDSVGVPPTAADILREAISGGTDITPAVPELRAALSNRYAKANAAAALAVHYHSKGELGKLEEFLSSSDSDIQRAAVDAVSPMRK